MTLDELPYGHFVELEGQDPLSLRRVGEQLDLDWDAQALASYSFLFEQLRLEQGYSFNDLTFDNFKELTITPEMLHVRLADV